MQFRAISSGRKLGNFVIKTILGKGAQGVVYLAQDTLLNRSVAVKVFQPAKGGGINHELLREARLSAGFDHPSIVKIFQLAASKEFSYMAMEFMEGGSLANQIRAAGSLPLDQIYAWMETACHALGYAHGQGIIHRDIKPQNFLLNRHNRLKIGDFGLATESGLLALVQNPQGGLVGTPQFMAPEIWNGGAATVKSDLYSLGACFYFMLTAKPPFNQTDLAAMKLAHQKKRILFPQKIKGPLRELIADCMAKNPDERPEDTNQVLSRLKECQQNTGSSSTSLEGRKEPASGYAWEKASGCLEKNGWLKRMVTQLSRELSTSNRLICFSLPWQDCFDHLLESMWRESPEFSLMTQLVLSEKGPGLPQKLGQHFYSARLQNQSAESIIQALEARIPRGKLGVLHILTSGELGNKDMRFLLEILAGILRKPIRILLTGPAGFSQGVVSASQLQGVRDHVEEVHGAPLTAERMKTLFEAVTKAVCSSKIHWTKDALLLAHDFLKQSENLVSFCMNATAIAAFNSMRMITTWCVIGARQHHRIIKQRSEILPPWQQRPTSWPDPDTQRMVARLRKEQI